MNTLTNRQFRQNALQESAFVIEMLLILVLSQFLIPIADDVFFPRTFDFNSMKELTHNVIYYGNGRILGNLLGFTLTQIPKVYYALEAVMLALLSIGIEKLADLKGAKLLVLSNFFFLPAFIFYENIGWIAVFINYYIPIIILIYTLLIIKKANGKYPIWICILFILGLSEQLFIEHNTIINILISTCLILYFKKRKAKKIILSVSLLISNLIGGAILFGYKFYVDYSKTFVFNHQNGYRKTLFSAGGIKAAIEFAAHNMKNLFIYFFASVFITALLFWAMFYIEKAAKIKNLKSKKPLIFCCVFYYIFSIPAICLANNNLEASTILPSLILSVAFVFAILMIIKLYYKVVFKRMNKRQRMQISACTVFAILSACPFAIVAPVSMRSFFLTFFFLITAVLITLKFAKEEYGFNLAPIYNIVPVLACIIIVVYTALLSKETKVYNYRTQYYEACEYLPNYATKLIRHNDDEVWDMLTEFKHKYIPLDEFEHYIKQIPGK